MTFTAYAPEPKKSTRPGPQARAAMPQKRTIGEDAVPAPGHSSANLPDDYRTINGWGADLDPSKRPAVPRELPSDVKTVRGDVRHWQTPRSKILMSNEHPGITPVFGDTVAPRGVSGLLRDYAYQFGEGTSRHWMTLLLADRIDVYETAIIDMLRGDYVKEKGWAASFRYGGPQTRRRNLFIAGAAISAIVLGVVVRQAMKD